MSIRRAGYDKLIDVEVVRDEIRIPSVPSAFMINPTTGYIQLRDFSETTDRELGAALRELTKQGMKQVLLDIRENPGGPLDQAIKVSNRFLKKGDLIVYTRGRIPNSDQDYHGVENSDYTEPAADCAGEPPQRERVRNRDRRACRITIAAWSSERRRGARRSCSRFTASAKARGLR